MKLTEKILIFLLVAIPIVVLSMQCASNDPKQPEKQVQTSSDDVNQPVQTIANEAEQTGDETESSEVNIPVNYPEKLRIAYAPSIQSGEVMTENKELDRLLSEKLGIPVESSVLMSYVAAVTGLASNQIDCAMVNPLGYVLGKDKFNIDVIAKVKKNGSTEYYGQVIVNRESGIDYVSQLPGHKFAFVDRTSTSGHLWARSLLLTEGINPKTDFSEPPAFVGSHDKVALDVMNGVFDAGATFQDVRERLKDEYPEIMEKTNVIIVYGPIPTEMFCVSTKMDPGFRKVLLNALVDISNGIEEDGKILKPFYEMDKIEEIIPALDSDYDIVRELIDNLDIDVMAEVK